MHSVKPARPLLKGMWIDAISLESDSSEFSEFEAASPNPTLIPFNAVPLFPISSVISSTPSPQVKVIATASLTTS